MTERLSLTDARKDWVQEKKGVAEDEMAELHHWLNQHEFEQTPGDNEGQRSLVCCRPWDCEESDTTEPLNDKKWIGHIEKNP